MPSSRFYLRSFSLSLLLTLPLAGAWAQSAPTSIGSIQGNGSAATPGTYTVEGIVTAVYPNLSPAGFYVQNDVAGADGDPSTSDALFVVQPAPTVAVGSRVRISGTVQEDSFSPSFGQAVLTGPAVTVLGSGQALPAFTTLSAPTFVPAAAEPYEGMRVEFASPLTVVDNRTLASRGEVTLSLAGVMYQPTQVVDPNDSPASGTSSTGTTNVAAVNAYQAANLSQLLVLDDGNVNLYPTPVPFLDPATGTLRVGSTFTGLRAILSYGYSQFRLLPLAGADAPRATVQRPALPTFGPLDLKLTSFNVLNYFNGDGQGGGFPTARGAATPADFQRQRSKIIVALRQIDADVLGLMEIENDGTGPNSALQDLLNGLNQAAGAGTYALIDDGALRQPGNSDLIHCAILYKPARVSPLGPAVLGTGLGVFERPPLAQLFSYPGTGDTFAFVVNHFKSKGSGSGLNADQRDGQGPSNYRRKTQAQGLLQFINNTLLTGGTSRVLSVGDYNAYYEEDPLDILRAAGLVVTASATASSYVFNGNSGSLDHAVITPNMVSEVEVHKWAINSVEPEFLEYDFAGAATDVTSPFRSSDHDPVLIGLKFSSATATAAPASTPGLAVYPNPTASTWHLQLTGLPAAAALTLELRSAQGQVLLRRQGTASTLQTVLDESAPRLAPGLYLLRLHGAGLQESRRVLKR